MEGGVLADAEAGTPQGSPISPLLANIALHVLDVAWAQRHRRLRMLVRLELSKPVIAAIEGHAVAGGLELALWWDLRVAGKGALVGVSCRHWSVCLVDGGTVRLPRLIGESGALDMILTDRLVEAAETPRFGLVNRPVPSGTASRVAEKLGTELSSFSQTCLWNDRQCVRYQAGPDSALAIAFELRVGMESFATGALEGGRRLAAGAGRHGSFEIG